MNSIKVTESNISDVNSAKEHIQQGEYKIALDILRKVVNKKEAKKQKQDKSEQEQETNEDEVNIYPKELASTSLEEKYIGMMLNDLKGIVKYYILFDDCYFADSRLLEIYKLILFTDAEKYAPTVAKDKFNFANVTYEINQVKARLKEEYADKKYDMEKIYVEIRKLFELRKNYLAMPIKNVQDK